MVIAIIALLIALVLPALGKAKAAARAAKCLSNQRSIGEALSMYVNENRETVPREGYMPNPRMLAPGRPAPVIAPVWAVALRQFLDPSAPPGYTRSDLFMFAPYYLCPSRQADGHRINYIVNGIFFIAPGVPVAPRPRNPIRRIAVSFSLIARPADTCFSTELADDRSRTFYNLVYPNGGNPPAMDDGEIAQYYDLFAAEQVAEGASTARVTSKRHGRGSNVGYLDGHASLTPSERLQDMATWDDGIYNQPVR